MASGDLRSPYGDGDMLRIDGQNVPDALVTSPCRNTVIAGGRVVVTTASS